VWAVLAGAFLFICGVLVMTWEALGRRRLSEPPSPDENDPKTLEPRHQGLRFLGLTRNWHAAALMAAGAILLLFGAIRYALVL
jgi:hypothetical protein